MAVSIVHAHVSAVANDATKDVSSTKWNEAHTLSGVTAFAETILDDADAATVRATIAAAGGTGTASGTNTGDQTSIVGISGTKAQFDTAVTDGNFAYASDLGSYQPLDTQLTDLAGLSYAANALKLLRVNAGETGWELVAAGAGTGDVVGPASATDNAIVRFDLTTGKLIQNSAATINDSGWITLAAGSYNTPSLNLGSGSNAITDYLSGIYCIANGASVTYLKDGVRVKSSGIYGFSDSASFASSAADTTFSRPVANQICFGGATSGAGAVTSRAEMNKAIASIADATATDVFTVTIPNASHSATVKVTLAGKIGAGGAIGAGEATGTISYDIAIARTAGVNAVASISPAYGSAVCAVAGATTITVAGTLGAITGAVGASNTFTIKVTVTKGGGASANHTCLAYCQLLNANSTGITVA